MKNALYILAALMICMPLSAQTSNELQSAAEKLASDPTFSHATVAMSARTVGGRQLIDLDSDKLLIPASNMKLISTGAALYALGPDYRYETVIGHDGEIIDGTLHGNLYIVGGGDPTTGSKDSIAVSIEKTFGQWKKILDDAGITRIEGHIVGDGRWLDGMLEEPTWMMNDIGTYYGTGVTGLMFYENMLSFNVSAGKRIGDTPSIVPYYPETPWIEVRYDCSTGLKGTGDKLYMYTGDLAPVAEIRGTFGIDRAAKRVDFANKYPEYTCAAYFQKWLSDRGLECSAGAADFRLEKGWIDTEFEDSTSLKDLKVIGSTLSPTLDRIAFETNHASNNLFAETLLRTLGKDMKGSSCYDSSYVALNDILKQLKVDKGPVQIQDGSGLSRQNYISPRGNGRNRSMRRFCQEPSITWLQRLPQLQHERISRYIPCKDKSQERFDERCEMLQRLHPPFRIRHEKDRQPDRRPACRNNHFLHHDQQLHFADLEGASDAGPHDGSSCTEQLEIIHATSIRA